jgi:hypothetical protein
MPNWCDNYMKITGAAEEIARFKQTCIIDGELDFNAIIPMPANVQHNNATGEDGLPVWYKWSCDHWGTNWNACDFGGQDKEDGSFECVFSTAWASPVPVWEKMGEMFPALTFELGGSSIEGDFAFKGSIRNGRLELRETPLILTITDPKTGEEKTGTSAELGKLGYF